MSERTVKVLEGKTERVLIIEREDGVFSYRRQNRAGQSWAAEGPDCGLYDSVDTAETEARQRVWWLAAASER